MPTINDIATLTGVSKATVSNVLNNKGRVSDGVREKVLDAARQNNFMINSAARQLAKKRSGIIGLFVPDTDYLSKSIFFATLSAGVLDEAAKAHCGVSLAAIGKEKLFDSSVKLDGAIILNPENKHGYYEQILNAEFPVVIIGRPDESENLLNYVDVENISISYMLTKMMLDLNHRRIMLIIGPREYTISQDQTTGYQKAHQDIGIRADESLIFSSNYFLKAGLTGFEEKFKEIKPTAILCPTDKMAIEIVQILLENGLNVPRDVSVACLTGSFITENFIPKITGITVPGKEMGVSATKMLLRQIEKKLLRPVSRIIDYSICEGQSIAKKSN